MICPIEEEDEEDVVFERSDRLDINLIVLNN
jgi:hypothetical protein